MNDAQLVPEDLVEHRSAQKSNNGKMSGAVGSSDRWLFRLFVAFWLCVFIAYAAGYVMTFRQYGETLPRGFILGFAGAFLIPLAIVWMLYRGQGDRAYHRVRRMTAKERAMAMEAEAGDHSAEQSITHPNSDQPATTVDTQGAGVVMGVGAELGLGQESDFNDAIAVNTQQGNGEYANIPPTAMLDNSEAINAEMDEFVDEAHIEFAQYRGVETDAVYTDDPDPSGVSELDAMGGVAETEFADGPIAHELVAGPFIEDALISDVGSWDETHPVDTTVKPSEPQSRVLAAMNHHYKVDFDFDIALDDETVIGRTYPAIVTSAPLGFDHTASKSTPAPSGAKMADNAGDQLTQLNGDRASDASVETANEPAENNPPAEPEATTGKPAASMAAAVQNNQSPEPVAAPMRGVDAQAARLDLGDEPVAPPQKPTPVITASELRPSAAQAQSAKAKRALDRHQDLRDRLDAPELPIGSGNLQDIDLNLLAVVLDFQDQNYEGEWREGFAAVNADGHFVELIRAAERVLEVFEGEGIYVEELVYRGTAPEIWRRFAKGERGDAVASLATIRDRTVLKISQGRARADSDAQALFLNFQKRFIMMLEETIEDADDAAIEALSTGRAGRAFAILAQTSRIIRVPGL